MRNRKMTGFTLVEILIVVVILGILAAIVIPQFTSASQEAIKGALASQGKTIESQFELYRVRNQGVFPLIGAAAGTDPKFPNGQGGWAVLVSLQYLKQQPYNGFTSTSNLVDAAGATPNFAAGDPTPQVTTGWGYRAQDLVAVPPLTAHIFANGYDPVNNLLSNEIGYTTTIP